MHQRKGKKKNRNIRSINQRRQKANKQILFRSRNLKSNQVGHAGAGQNACNHTTSSACSTTALKSSHGKCSRQLLLQPCINLQTLHSSRIVALRAPSPQINDHQTTLVLTLLVGMATGKHSMLLHLWILHATQRGTT